ncbi:MAG TPA: thymidylate synthase [Candidatus Dojkabacteria bacterium]|jgi:thymidylate synthase
MHKIDILYKKALQDILEKGSEEEDKRLFHKEQTTNESKTKAIAGYTFQFDMEEDGFPLISLRKLPVRLFVAETIWFLTGSNKVEGFLDQYTKIWDFFKEDDGTVTGYGNRWRKHFDRDQVIGVLEMLKKDPTSRHGVVMTWDPSSDSLSNGIKRKNVPCQVGFIVNITNGRLNFHSIWRSVDMILGFPSDVPGNALLAHIFAAYLGLKVGIYTNYIANAHIYNIHYEIAEELIARDNSQQKIEIEAKEDWFVRGSKGDHSLVKEITSIIKPQYKDAGEPMKGIKIVV